MKRKTNRETLKMNEMVREIQRIAVYLGGGQMDDEALVRATLSYPPARTLAIDVIPYAEHELRDPEPIPETFEVDLDGVHFSSRMLFKDTLLEDVDDEVPDEKVFMDTEQFVRKLFMCTPSRMWYRHSIASSYGDLRDKLRRAAHVCGRKLPAQREAVRRICSIIEERGARHFSGDAKQKPGPIFLFGLPGHGTTTMLKTLAEELGCRFLVIEDQISSCGALISELEDNPPTLIEVEGFPSSTPGGAVYSLLSFCAHGHAAHETYDSSEPFSHSNSEDLARWMNNTLVFVHVLPPLGVSDPAAYTAEEMVVLLRNAQQEALERCVIMRETPPVFWDLIKNHNSVVMALTSCRHMTHRLYREFRCELRFLHKHLEGVELTIDSVLKLCAVLILGRGYPTPRDLDGAARRLLFEIVDLVSAAPGAQRAFRVVVEKTNGDLPAVLARPTWPLKRWFSALEAQARQQSYSGHRLTYKLRLDRECGTVTLCDLAMRAPKAVDGGAFMVTRPKVRFADVVGLDDAKERMETLVRYLRNPESFRALDVVPARRILLVGPPGSGKTMLAQAFAGETGLPFFSVSASEITSQKYAGWGGMRLRELFVAARVYRPSIIFVDELDAFGRRDGMGESEAGLDAKSILNTLLVELDGVGSAEDIIVIGATNRPDDLDIALTRPRRFGTRVECEPLKAIHRSQLVRRCLSPRICGDEYEALVEYITLRTAGPFSPAEIEEMVSEAKLAAERAGLRALNRDVVAQALDCMLLGKKFRELSPDYRASVARHEAGHAVCLRALLPHQRIERLTIGLRLDTAGLTLLARDEEQVKNLTRDEVLCMIVVFLAGALSEQALKGHWDVGTGFDLDKATTLASQAVADLGVGLGIRGAALRYMTQKGDPWPVEYQHTVSLVLERCFLAAQEVVGALEAPIARLAEELEKKEDLGHEEVDAIIGPLECMRDKVVTRILSYNEAVHILGGEFACA